MLVSPRFVMLASLFYTRAPPRELDETAGKGNNPKGDFRTYLKDENTPISLPQQSAVTNCTSSSGYLTSHKQRRKSHSGVFISSADVFKIADEPSTSFFESESTKNDPILDETAFLERIKPLFHGWLVRRRMRSRLGCLLISQILEFKNRNRVQNKLDRLSGDDSSHRAICISHLVSFLEHGVSNKEDDERQKTPKKKVVKLLTKPSFETKKRSSDVKLYRQLSLPLYSSDKAKIIGQHILTSLQEAVGTEESDRGNIIRDITPTFLSERRSVFLLTIFGLEDSEKRFAQIPRLVMGDGSDVLSSDRSFISMFGGQYFQVIENLNHLYGALR
ncbi:hypothetical protein TraAM80_07923 [Trypanosoma rangeli]|uniref:Uncharacterized protein n=1 Tax=Trypanosoma rangeli TaxID=5698 RepID=A0A422N349_TRYRA|nr:uncharacterized protein TraAM80_07923 [Trypanosoma rangeli]RNE99907.1 hypothetical protein TraAM80_07923 [Trypanosoma rangeli]|eukprot:RNE99907.1 hypothetical protein TraAM80_07923 [Trypanosoma rangeli]